MPFSSMTYGGQASVTMTNGSVADTEETVKAKIINISKNIFLMIILHFNYCGILPQWHLITNPLFVAPTAVRVSLDHRFGNKFDTICHGADFSFPISDLSSLLGGQLIHMVRLIFYREPRGSFVLTNDPEGYGGCYSGGHRGGSRSLKSVCLKPGISVTPWFRISANLTYQTRQTLHKLRMCFWY